MAKGLDLLKKLTKNTAVGGLSGYIASRIASTPAEADKNSIVGGKVGAFVGASIAASPTLGKIVFRKFRGRVIPIRMKK